MNGDLQLDSLLRALRTAGLRVGISEVLRLQQVFANAPGVGEDEVPRKQLRSLLRAVLVKSIEDRGTFDRVCDAWLGRAEEEMELRRARPRRVLAPLQARHGFRWKMLLRQAATAAALCMLLLTINEDTKVPKRTEGKTLVVKPTLIPQPSKMEKPGAKPARSVAAPVATANRWRFLPWQEIRLAALACLSAGGLWFALLRRRLLPEPGPLAPASGPPRAFPSPVAPAGAILLSLRDQEGLAWGIGRFVAEEPTRRLDLAATVRATAQAGGLPEMRFHRARLYREVWLWVDEDANDPALPRLAAEVEAVLAAHGLPVERAAFRGVPNRLVTATGQVFGPKEIDERHDVALVAVLTDGRRLVRRWVADDQRVRIDSLLRSLSHWPHLVFVDASGEEAGLAAILGRHGIPAVTPERAAIFLGGVVPPRAASRPAGGTDQAGEAVWAAACALCPAPVDELTALELRRRLGIATSPYSLQALRSAAPGPPGRLAWRSADRIRLVSWLREAEAHPAGAVMPDSLLGRALDFWEGVYDRTLGEHPTRAGEDLGDETLTERFLRMERALLGLWRKPRVHIAELYRLYQGPLQEIIGQHCETLAPADWGGASLIHLPWLWSERSPVERALLRKMRLGGGMPPVDLQRPGRAWLGLGLLIGLGLAATGMAAFGCRNSQIEDNGFVFVRICSGTFTMGSKGDDPMAEEDEMVEEDELPIRRSVMRDHEVTLDQFWMSKSEVTNEQYQQLHPDHKGEPNLPVTNVSWFDAFYFCKKLGYSLPTEAEWEYAARAGTATPWSFGSNQRELGRFAWFEGNSGNQPHPVGQKGPNPWSLYDIHGNVLEWVWDTHERYIMTLYLRRNPSYAVRGKKVLRGGSFRSQARFLRSADRFAAEPEFRSGDIGFRCVWPPIP